MSANFNKPRPSLILNNQRNLQGSAPCRSLNYDIRYIGIRTWHKYQIQVETWSEPRICRGLQSLLQLRTLIYFTMLLRSFQQASKPIKSSLIQFDPFWSILDIFDQQVFFQGKAASLLLLRTLINSNFLLLIFVGHYYPKTSFFLSSWWFILN